MGSPPSPQVPPVPPPPPLPPQLTSREVSASGQAFQAQQAGARGFASTILTSGQGVDSSRSYATKTLTGQ